VSETVLVLGSGPVGLSCIILARLQGAGKILCIGAPDSRLQIAREVGADEVLNFEESSVDTRREWVLERTFGRGADVTLEATGQPVAVVQAMRWTRDAGRVVVVGQYTDHGEVAFNPHLDLNKKHLDLLACWGSDFSHFFRGTAIMANPIASRAWSKIQLDRYGLDRAGDALQAVSRGRAVKALIDPNLEADPG
jgi:L-iditol 2-dehydrogenase